MTQGSGWRSREWMVAILQGGDKGGEVDAVRLGGLHGLGCPRNLGPPDHVGPSVQWSCPVVPQWICSPLRQERRGMSPGEAGQWWDDEAA